MSALVSPRGRSASPGMRRHGGDAIDSDAPARLARHRTFHTLDALRGIAAIAVVLYHTAFFYGITPPAEGQIAVDLFFVMSGFIIVSRYEADLASGMSLGAFVKIRLIRLYPLFLLGMVLGAIPSFVALASGHAEPIYKGLAESFPLSVLMLPSPFAMPMLDTFYPLNYVAWSLSLEVVVNVAYAATVRTWTVRNLVALLAVSFVGLCVCAAVYGNLDTGYTWPNAIGGLPRVLYGFGMGVLIFRLRALGALDVRLPWWVFLAATVALFVFDPTVIPLAGAKPAWEVVAITIGVPLIVIGAIANEPPKALQGSCALAGVFSYVVYSLHAPFVGFFMRGEERLHFDVATSSPGRAVVFTVLLVALCVVAHLAYDKPVRRFLTRLGRVGRSRPPTSRPAAEPAQAKN